MIKFVICISNDHPGSLILGRVYRTVPDAGAAKHNLIRVLDETYGESGSEDGYLYPATAFVPIDLPETAERVLITAGGWVPQPG